MAVAEANPSAVKMIVRLPAEPLIATLSVGACLVSPDNEWDDWYALADAALYRAKRLGGNRVEWQDDALAPA